MLRVCVRGGRFRALLRTLDPGLQVIAVAAEQGGAPAEADASFSTASLWGRTIDLTAIDPAAAQEVRPAATSPEEAPAEPASVEIAFEQGAPVAVNGVAMPLLDLIASLTAIAGAHRTGRAERVQQIASGAVAHELYEGPAAVALHAAHAHLQATVIDASLQRFCRTISLEYSAVIANGEWFTPLRDALDRFVEKVQERVTGTVRLTMFKGDCRVIGSQSPNAVHQGAGDSAGPAIKPAEPLAAGLR
jgi:argininosuccinate synthase